MLKACLNGDRPATDPRVPCTPAQLASDAAAALASGATMVHVHPRDASGSESLSPDDIAAAVRAIRPTGTRISVSTRDGIVPSKLALIRSWPAPPEGPDCASVNWHERDAVEVAAALEKRGIGVEAGIWSVAAAKAFARSGWAPRVERVLVEIIPGHTPGAEEPVRAAEDIVAALGEVEVRELVVHGEQEAAWPVLRFARTRGYSARIGMEDTPVLENGDEGGIAELVRAALGL